MFENKKIFILGMARSGYEVAKLLIKQNCNIIITDKIKDEEKIKELTNLGVKCIITENQIEYFDNTFDYVIKNPGVPIDHPIYEQANKFNIPIINEIEVATSFLKNTQIVAITGSNGKTTTTSLIYEILKQAKLNVHLGGNIGIPLSAIVNDIKANDILVLETSSHQLYDFKNFTPTIAVMTNITPTHIDHFKTYEVYKKTKQKIFNNCKLAIVNQSKECVDLSKNTLNKLYFSSKSKSNIYKSDCIIYDTEKIINLKEIKLKGDHNYENIMCAIAVAKYFKIDNLIIKEVLKTFNGVQHRLEFLEEVEGIKFYNDSKSTNTESTIIALKSFTEKIILLLGGLDRKHSFDDLIPYLQNVKCIICFGETKNRINEFCNTNSIPCFICENLKEATKKAYTHSIKDDIILLSPACASWDQYKSFEKRGEDFKIIVNQIKKEGN